SADRQEIQPPRDVLDRVRARLHENTVRSPLAAPAQAATPWTRRAWFAGGRAAGGFVGALLFSLYPSNSAWSRVTQAVRATPWIHVKAVGGEGKARETWLSFARNVAAMRDGDLVRYDDFRSGIRFEYDAQKKKLFRLSATSGAAREFESAEGLFQAIFRGNAIRERNSFPSVRIVKQRQRPVTEQGRQWLLYELELQRGDPDDTDANNTVYMVIRVHPEKMLPDSLTITHGKDRVELAFDYPAEGPADIYALGVPRGAAVEDRTPPPDLSRILK